MSVSIPTMSSDSNLVDASGGSKKNSGPLSALLGAGRTYFLFAIIAAVVAMFAVLSVLSTATARDTYFVLTQDVAERTEVTRDMLEPVETLRGTGPVNALDLSQLFADDGSPKVALVALAAGEPVTSSTVGAATRIGAGFPADYVIASFQVEAKDAVGGKVRAGDRIDVIAVDDSTQTSTTAKVILHDVPVVDVTVDPATVAEGATDGEVAAGPDSVAVRNGIPQVYSVAVTPADAAKIAAVGELRLVVTLLGPDAPATARAKVSLGELFASNSTVGSSAPQTATDPVDDGQVQPGAAVAETTPSTAPPPGAAPVAPQPAP